MKLTNEIIDKRLEGRNIFRCSDFINSKDKMSWRCLVCGNCWTTRASVIMSGKKHGCRKCAMKGKTQTNETIDKRLIGREIKRIDDFVCVDTAINFQCLKCNYIWKTRPNYILNSGSGCPPCAGNLRLNNELVDKKLIGRNIIRLEDYRTNKIPILWGCSIQGCGHTWSVPPQSILNDKDGCAKCAGNLKLTNNAIDERLAGKTIKRMGEYINSLVPISWECLICFYTWDISPNVILNGGVCPKCADILPITNEAFDEKIKDYNLKRIGDYVNNHTKIQFQCLKNDCQNVWEASPGNILHGYGCPLCPNRNEKIIYKLFTQNNIVFEHQKSLQSLNNKEDRKYRIDFYLPKYGLAIEYNGEQHYQAVCFGSMTWKEANRRFPLQQERDEYVRTFCKNNNVVLLEIDGRIYNYKKLDQYIKMLIEDLKGKYK